MEGGRWTFYMSKKQTLGKKSKHWSSRREGRRLEEEDNDDEEGEDNFFYPREFIHPWDILPSSSFFSFSWVIVVVVVVVVGLEANSFLFQGLEKERL